MPYFYTIQTHPIIHQAALRMRAGKIMAANVWRDKGKLLGVVEQTESSFC